MRICSIEHLKDEIDIYDICIDKFHNFSLDAGIYAHNSELRELMIPRSLYSIMVHYDYSQAEIRVMAALAGEQVLIDAFARGEDVHRTIAAGVWNKPADKVTDGERHYSKMACLHGDTIIKCIDGTYQKIKDLYNNHILPEVYSFDTYGKRIIRGKSYNVQLTKFVNKLAIIEFENGKSIKCTIDHPLLKTNGEYTIASELREGDQIETLFYKIASKGAYSDGYEVIRNVRHVSQVGTKNPNIKSLVRTGKWEPTHRYLFNGNIDEGYQIDHINENKLDNSASNLQILSESSNLIKGVYNRSRKGDGFCHKIRCLKVIEYLIKNKLEVNRLNYNCARHIGGKRTIYFDKMISTWPLILEDISLIINRSKFTDPIGKCPKSFNFRQLGWKVSSVRTENFDVPEPVYDLSIDKYHNYAIDLGDSSAVFVHNTFSILFGKSEDGFARDFLGGDITRAHKIFENFFTSFPKIAAWCKKMNALVLEQRYVTTLFGDKIWIEYDPSSKGSVNQAKRYSQNYPIQSSSSSMAALGIWDLWLLCKENLIESVPFCFTHDSSDWDTYLDHLIRFMRYSQEAAVEHAIKKYNVPMKIDFELGINQNFMLEIKKPKFISDTEFESKFECSTIFFDKIIEKLRLRWKVDYTIDSQEVIQESMNELFMTKRAYSMYIGKPVTYNKGKLQIRQP